MRVRSEEPNTKQTHGTWNTCLVLYEPGGSQDSQGRTRRGRGAAVAPEAASGQGRPGVRGQQQARTSITKPAACSTPDHSFYIPRHYLYAPPLPPVFSQTLTCLQPPPPLCASASPLTSSARAASRQGQTKERLPIPPASRSPVLLLLLLFTSSSLSGRDGHATKRQPQLGAGAVPVGGRRRPRRRGVRHRREGALRRRHLRLRGRGVAGRGSDGFHDRAGDGERDAARRRHWGHLRRRLLHRGRRGVAGPLALGRRLRRLDRPQHGGHHLQPPERQAGPGEGGPGCPERRAESDQRHQLAVRGDERPVRDGGRQGPAGGGAAAAAGDGDRGGQRRGRGGGGAVLLGVPAGLPGGRARQEAPRVPPRVPRALHRLLARQARLLPALPARHLI